MSANRYTIDTSSELCIARQGCGIKLVRPDNIHHGPKKYTVSDILSLAFNVYFLDCESKIQKCNEGTASTLKFISTKGAEKRSVLDALKKPYAQSVIQQDRQVIETQQINIIEDYGVRSDGIELFCLSIKFPWFNDLDVMGVLGFTIMFGLYENASLSQALLQIMQTGLLALPNKSIYSKQLISYYENKVMFLTDREKQILTLLVRGKTAKEIAFIINRSKRTVEHHLENVKRKMGVASKSELIEKAMHGFP
jgi:DNA-binding CsgD family transcriptional regulator